ncbi:MAG: hypothetical protein UHU19_18650 [Lachnospiraceae bacterium]|nr:hypothetical protein [Lachnospiraceae bacterium]
MEKTNKVNNGLKKAMVFALAAACMSATFTAPKTIFAEEISAEQAVDENIAASGRTVPHYNLKDPAEKGGSGMWDGTYYYLPDGALATDAFFCDGKDTYYLQKDGTPMKEKLTYHPDGEHIIYFDNKGHEVFNNFTKVKCSISGMPVDDLCFFDTFGYMYVDVVTYDQAGINLYYANPYGVVERNGWFTFSKKQGGGLGYANPNGTLMKDMYTYDESGNVLYMESDGSVRGSRGNVNTKKQEEPVITNVYTGRNGVNPNVIVRNQSFKKDTGSHGKIEVQGDYLVYGGYFYPIEKINANSANYHFVSPDAHGDVYPLGNTVWNGVDFASIFKGGQSAYQEGYDESTQINWFMDYGIYEQASGGREWFYPDYYACNYYDELSSMYGKDLVYYYLDYACYGVSENKQARTILLGNEKYL